MTFKFQFSGIPRFLASSRCLSARSLSNDEGNGNENVTWKYIFISFVVLRNYFNSLNFYQNGKLSRNQIDRSGVQVKKENAWRTPRNVCVGGYKEMY